MNYKEIQDLLCKEGYFWFDIYQNYLITAKRHCSLKVWLAYVYVPDAKKIFPNAANAQDFQFLSCHGGVTYYGERCNPESENALMQLEIDSRDGNDMWIGFDCGHYGDWQYLEGTRYEGLGEEENGVLIGSYRDIKYVENQLRNLVDQLKSYQIHPR